MAHHGSGPIFIIVCEDVDGQWFSDPKVFRNEAAARKWARDTRPPEGYEYKLYHGVYMMTLA